MPRGALSACWNSLNLIVRRHISGGKLTHYLYVVAVYRAVSGKAVCDFRFQALVEHDETVRVSRRQRIGVVVARAANGRHIAEADRRVRVGVRRRRESYADDFARSGGERPRSVETHSEAVRRRTVRDNRAVGSGIGTAGGALKCQQTRIKSQVE